MTNRKATRAVTLLEVNLALGVLVFGVISVAALFPIGIRTSEEACRATDGAFIAAQAKAQVENLSCLDLFRWPDVDVWANRPGSREGLVDLVSDSPNKEVVDRASENRPTTGRILPVTGLKCSDLKWKANWWKPVQVGAGSSGQVYTYVLMTSGMDAGKLFPILSNTEPDPRTLIAKITLDFTNDLEERSNIHGGDSFRIIYNPSGTRSIPTDFLRDPGTSGQVRTIPTITGIPMEVVRGLRNDPSLGMLKLRQKNSAFDLDQLGVAKYTYAIILDGPELGSPNLYCGFVLIYRNYDPGWAQCYNDPPVDYYPFFYRRPSLAQKQVE